MGSLIVPTRATVHQATDLPAIPELDDSEYLFLVLRLPEGETEASLEDTLINKATSLGISTCRPLGIRPPGSSSTTESASTIATTHHARTPSTQSHGSALTALTALTLVSSVEEHEPEIEREVVTTKAGGGATTVVRRRSKSLSFARYDKYLSRLDQNAIGQPRFFRDPPADRSDLSNANLFGINTKRSYTSLKQNIRAKLRWNKRPGTAEPAPVTLSCICCRDDFNKSSALQSLPCGHTYCGECLKVMVSQATTEESKMPPRCCTQPIPSSVIKSLLLTQEEQDAFLKSVLQFSTPWEARLFCPNTGCGEFIPQRRRVDPKHPFAVACKACQTRVCAMCKREAHPVGQDCPDDWELEAVLQIGEKSGWRRCYKCRTLVELTQGCTHMTCRCKAEFCYICGAVWDPAVGCPNFCNGEEVLERRRVEEEARMAELQAEKEAQEVAAAAETARKEEAERRTRECTEFRDLLREQAEELDRFQTFRRKCKWVMWARHSQEKLEQVDKFTEQVDRMKERHNKTAQHLEDRQVAGEMELRQTLEQMEKSVKIRLRHMEAYCDGLGQNPDPDSDLPVRTVTERDLRELGQQYNLRDGIERLHQARINVLRDRQTRKMEELLERQAAELERLERKREEETDDLGARFAEEEDGFAAWFGERASRMRGRWGVQCEMLRREMEEVKGVEFTIPEPPSWVDEDDEREQLDDEEVAEQAGNERETKVNETDEDGVKIRAGTEAKEDGEPAESNATSLTASNPSVPTILVEAV